MAHLTPCARSNLLPSLFPRRHGLAAAGARKSAKCPTSSSSFKVSSSSSTGGDSGSDSISSSDSYLDMWKKAMEMERKSQEFYGISSSSSERDGGGGSGGSNGDSADSLDKKTEMFNKILEVPSVHRDRVQRLQVIDRAAAAIAAARALLKEAPPPSPKLPVAAGSVHIEEEAEVSEVSDGVVQEGLKDGSSFRSEVEPLELGSPGPNFWSWSPPQDNGTNSSNLQPNVKSNVDSRPSFSLMEKERSVEFLSIPFQSTLPQSEHSPPLPPLQSIVEFEKVDTSPSPAKQDELDELFSGHAAEAAEALGKSSEASSHGMNPDGSKWWKETGVERRPDGVVCKWTLTRGVSADGAVEWEDKYWEASDQFDHKELGSEKSGRDAAGNVWREYWKESMWQDLKSGLLHMEKTADKWGKDSRGSEWHEKWWEHYDASGQAEKWAHKWCSIDPSTPLEAGHAHTWHERWGEKYDGKGGSIKYTDKWAERSEGDGWSKWGDKWDENFNSYGHGVKQGETWWEGKYGEQWNRTWGEHHNGSGWIHKYGKSSSGEHWDTHVQQDTWYERYPHFGFDHCFRNSVQLRGVRKPPKIP